MILRQKNRSHINKAYKAIEKMLQSHNVYQLVKLHIQCGREAELLVDHIIKGKLFVAKEKTGWSLKYLNNTPVECTSLVHVKKCIKQIFEL